MSKNTADHIFKQILNDLKCPYCKKEMKSASGKTLHIKKCQAKNRAIEKARELSVGTELRNNYTIKEIYQDLGLVKLDNDYIVSALDARPKKKKKKKKRKRIVVIPEFKRPLDWVKIHRSHSKNLTFDEFRKSHMYLAKHSELIKHKKWSVEDIEKAMDQLEKEE